jgi:predicted AAA+ superfamily ATPase
VKILSDEDTIWDELMQRLTALGAPYGCSFVSFPHRYRGRKIPDEEVPEICRSEDADALITINYKDFASELVYLQALLDAGVSVIVLRQPNPRVNTPDVDYQVALIEPHLRYIVRRLEQTDEPLLFVMNKSGRRVRRVQELMGRGSA